MIADLERVADVQPRVRSRLTAHEFAVASDAGSFDESMHVELIDGELVEMPSDGAIHAVHLAQSFRVLDRLVALRPPLMITTSMSVQLDTDRVVGPDIVVFDPLPGMPLLTPASRVRLAVEHAFSTRGYDTNQKAEYCAEGGVPEYWVLDDVAIRLHRFHTPTGGRYTRDAPLGPDDRVAVPFAPGETVRVGELFRLG